VGVRLALVVAFAAQAVTVYTLFSMPALTIRGLALDYVEQAMVAGLGLICIAAAYATLGVFLRARHRQDEQMGRSETFARATVNALPAHIAIVDEWGAIISTNRQWNEFAKKHGADPAKVGEGANYLAECDCAAARGCSEAAAIGTALRGVLAGKQEDFTLEYPFHHANQRCWFQVRISRFPGDGSACACVSHEDVTARKLAEERHENAKHEAEAANAAKSAFVANISHEIRTPMNAILGYADMLLDLSNSDQQRDACVKVIRRNGEHLLTIINDILDISKVEASRMAVERIPCDVPQLIADVIALTQSKAIEKGLKFEVTFDELIPAVVQTDPVRVKQVLVNLVGNAVKFTAKGAVRLRVSQEISYFNQTLRFSVSDTGIGMTSEQVSRLFKPFSQADVSTTRKFGGTGLGLTISKRLAQILGGDIEVETQDGVGSTFRFWIDGGPREGVELLKNLTQARLDVPQPAPITSGRDIHLRGKVLLAEDGEDNQHLLTTFLKQGGLQVALAVNGEIARRMALTKQYDLVLMDMQMPVMDGYRATSELRKAGYKGPIIALTAHAMPEDRAKCLEAGCTEYLSKPIDRRKLLATCAVYLAAAVQPLALSPEPESEAPQLLQSTLKSDPRVARVLDRFVGRLPQRVTELRGALEDGDLELLRQSIHNLKGAGSGYGFKVLSEQSAKAEETLKSEVPLEEIRQQVEELIGLIERVEGYTPTVEA
jgi:signal transduction histidine kinase/DNA-binding response OmpR family regulator